MRIAFGAAPMRQRMLHAAVLRAEPIWRLHLIRVDDSLTMRNKPKFSRNYVVSKLSSKFKRSGARGVAAAIFRSMSLKLEPKSPGETPDLGPPPDEFLTWVRFAVPGMLNPGNVEAIQYAAQHMPSGYPVIEIGSFCGLSTVVIGYMLRKYAKANTIFTCDKWEFEGQQLGSTLGDSIVTHDAYREYVKSTFLRCSETFLPGNLPHTIECFSDEFFSRWSERQAATDVFGRAVSLGGEIAFSYIDGNHTYEFAKRDFENTDRFLIPGGFVFFDDSSDDSRWEVNRLMHELATSSKYEFVSKNPNYLFRKR